MRSVLVILIRNKSIRNKHVHVSKEIKQTRESSKLSTHRAWMIDTRSWKTTGEIDKFKQMKRQDHQEIGKKTWEHSVSETKQHRFYQGNQ